MEILHIASFDGNIGDICNQNGFRRCLKMLFPSEKIVWEDCEIREFYNNFVPKRNFDKELIESFNSYDLVIIGGGGFFYLEWENSETGTTIDLPIELLDKTRVPLLFQGMGYSSTRTSEIIKGKFQNFMCACERHNNVLVSLRNDGSYDRFISDFPKLDVLKTPDGAFFCKTPSYNHVEVGTDKYITVNVAGDHKILGENWFVKGLANCITNIMEKNKDVGVIFIPHIYTDLSVIGDVLNYISDRLKRFRIQTAPLLTGKSTDGLYIADLYRKSTLNIGMRFHSNVVAISGGVPSVGVGTSRKTEQMFEELKISNYFVNPIKMDGNIDASWDNRLLSITDDILGNIDYHVKKIENAMDCVCNQEKVYLKTLSGFLENNGIVTEFDEDLLNENR